MDFNQFLNETLGFILPILAIFLFVVAVYGVVKKISFGEAFKELMGKIREGING